MEKMLDQTKEVKKCGWLNWKVVVKLRNHTQIGEKIDSLSMKYNIKYTVHHLI